MLFKEILEWQQAARPEPTKQDKAISIGIHLEEISEYLFNLAATTEEASELFNVIANDVHSLAEMIKAGQITPVILSRVDHADALGDQIVTAIGDLHNQGIDAMGVVGEINRSNWSKFVDGVPVFNENGKVIKGPDYTKPSLAEFV